MNLFDTAAYAADAAGTPGAAAAPGMDYSQIFVLVGFVAIFYFLLWRPQSKRRKEHQQLMASLAKGDEVVTAGGVVGRISKVEDDFIKLQVSNNVELRVQKSAIGATLPKGTLKSLDEK
jgi:preprotein translocase subunit YajC